MEPIGAVLVASGIALGLWCAGFVASWLSVRPSEPPELPEDSTLGPEPPAVAALLAGGFRVPREAVPATLLDLAARRHLSIDLVASSHHVLRLGKERAGDLTDYEEQLMDHLRRIAVHGVVPAAALTTGPKAVSAMWWFRFRESVIHDAQQRGLSVNRWTGRVVGRLWLGALFTGIVYMGGVRFSTGVALGSGPAALLLAGMLGMLFLAGAVTVSRTQRDTPAGLQAASRWRAVRAALARNTSFSRLPPSAVAIWERHFAYAAGMGLAAAAVEALPLGAEDARLAWSSQGGTWRKVRVRYPRLRPGWGMHPGVALAVSAAWAAPSAWLLAVILPLRPPDPGSASVWMTPWFWFRVEQLLAAVVTALLAVAAFAALTALADLGPPRTVSGAVLRMRSREAAKINPWRKRPKWLYFVAVDDGRPSVNAWLVSERQYAILSQGDHVRATASPRLGHVTEIVPASPGAGTEEPPPHIKGLLG